MQELTSRERISRILKHEPVDRVGVCESFWFDTRSAWAAAGSLDADADLVDHFGHDLRRWWTFNMVADLDFGDQIVEETDETKLVRNGNQAVLRWWKSKAGTPEHVDFLVTERAAWDEHIRPFLTDPDTYRRRIDFEGYRKEKAKAAAEDRFFCWCGVNVFEMMHPVCGHEHMLVGMALDPEWVVDMCNVYAELTINLMEILFAEEGVPDAVWFFEDLGFKERPFMSPAMFKEMIAPAHTRTFDFAHARDLPVIVHSCGFVEPLIPTMVESGMDCLQAMEVKAGMDLLRIKQQYGDRIALCGGLDIRELETNDPERVEALLDAKLPGAMEGSGYILHTDHSVPTSVQYPTYKHFLDYGLQVGTYAD